MKAKDRRQLLRAIAGELDPERRARIEALVRETPRSGFRPGFAGRVMARLTAEAPRRFSTALALHFRRLAPAALVVILGLLAHNFLTGGPDSRSALEAALGLQPVTLDVAYDFDRILYE